MATIGATTYGRPRPDLNDAFYNYDAGGAKWLAPLVAPLTPIELEAGTIETLDAANFTGTEETGWARGADVPTVDVTVGAINFTCRRDGLAIPVPEGTATLQLNKDRAARTKINHHIMKAWERTMAAVVQSTATFTGADLYLDTTTVWTDAAAKIIADINAAKAKVVKNSELVPDTLALSYKNLCSLLANTEIIGRFPGASVVSEQMLLSNLPGIFGLQKLFVGTTPAFSDSYVSVCKTANTSDMSETCAFRTLGYSPDLSGGGPVFDEYVSVEANVRKIRGWMTYGVTLMLTEAAFLLKVD